jgi:hypothetical protein
MKLALLAATLAAGAASLATPARAFADDDFGGGTIVFARGAQLLRIDPRGKGETELATLPANTTVRALRTDADGTVLLADLSAPGGLNKWTWLPLDGSTKQLADLPCADGPAQLAEDGTAVLCRSPDPKLGAIVYDLAQHAAHPLAIAAGGARLFGPPDARSVVWVDAAGIWIAPVAALGKRTKAAPAAPLRGFLPSPDGKRALGVFTDEIYTDAHHKQAADVLMNFALDGAGARRKAIRDGVPLEWSHDAQWVLVQDGGKACLMRASGGEYKCWKGFTGASLASDGSWALVLGERHDGSGGKSGSGKSNAKAAAAAPKPDLPPEATEDSEPAVPDVAVAPPTGPLSLYRAKLAGPYADAPALVARVVDGAAVWVPKRATAD